MKKLHHLLEVRILLQLADDHAGGVLSHVHVLHRQPLSQRVAPDVEDPSNAQVQP